MNHNSTCDEALEKLPWGWDLSFHLNFLPPCHSKEGKDEKFNIQFIKSSFTNKEQLIVLPRYTKQELKVKYEAGVDLVNELDPPPELKIGVLALMAREHASYLPIYKVEKSGDTLVGQSSYFCVQEKKKVYDVTPFHKTSVLMEFAKKKFKKLDANQKQDKVIELFCSIGVKSNTDIAYEPEEDAEDYFPEDGSVLVLRPTALDADAHRLFSQKPDELMAPPQEASKVAQSKVRQDMAADSRRFEEYIWALNTREESPYYHAITAEHYPVIKDQWMRRRLPDGQWIYEKFPCTPGQPNTYPSLDELPESIRTKPELFCGQLCEPGLHVPGTVMSSYAKYKKTEEERYEEEQANKVKTLDRVLATMAASRGGGGSIDCESFTIRFARSANLFIDVQVRTDDTCTLQSIYDKSYVKAAVRRGYSKEDRDAVHKGRKHIVLEHTNHMNGQIYRSIPPMHLSTTTIQQIWKSLPFNQSGFLDGAAFPVQFNIVMREIPQYGYSSDGEDGLI